MLTNKGGAVFRQVRNKSRLVAELFRRRNYPRMDAYSYEYVQNLKPSDDDRVHADVIDAIVHGRFEEHPPTAYPTDIDGTPYERRDPYTKWDNQGHRRNFNEPVMERVFIRS